MKRPPSPSSSRFEDAADVVAADQTSDSSALRVVLVDTRDERRQVMRHVVEGTEAGATVVGQADSAAAAIAVVGQQQADVVVLEIQMPLRQGLETLVALRESFPSVGIVVCSFHLNPATKEQAVARGADAYLAKPIGPRDLNAVLSTLGRRYSTAARSAEPNEHALSGR